MAIQLSYDTVAEVKEYEMRKVAILLGVLFLVVACKATPLKEAKELVAIGDLRDDAIVTLSMEAWYHQPCRNRNSIDDLFFYGSQKYDKADIVIVTSVWEDEKYRVSQVSSLESYAWHAAYQDCIDRNRFED